MKIVSKIVLSLLVLSTFSSAQVLVKVDGTKITSEDVDIVLMRATQGRFNQLQANQQSKLREQALGQLITRELIYADSKKKGMLKSKAFKTELKKAQKEIEKELSLQFWQKKELDKVKISNKALKKYYDKNKEEFNEKESAHARHILVKTEDEAKKIIKELSSAKNKKSKFIELAKSKSTGPSGSKGGDLGFFQRGQMVPEFDKVVFNMKPGKFTKTPVKTQFGFHVIFLEKLKAKRTKSFTESKSLIEQRLKLEKFKTIVQKKIKKLKSKAVIK